ncbi:aldose 1-epimerase [Rhizobium sp. G21]|uniref:aldose 1-epimerase n=1 Tax=Rhizobium sp. G21 TaxID=2758439 RepID=UPI0016034C57|nr:aldose 1-epimerase [Rhizobium sp. G21]MBB1251005.1 aldose 1-epimerase [Rhizobium sp. G21]
MTSLSLPLASDRIETSVSLQGGGLGAVRFDGVEVMPAVGGANGDLSCFPLVPFGNRVEFNRFELCGEIYSFVPNSGDPLYLHGDGWLSMWAVQEAQEDRIKLSLRQTPSAGTPYAYSAEQTLSVSGALLSLSLFVRNDGEEALPFGLGQHPFFLGTQNVRVEANVLGYWTERAGHLPDARTALPNDLDPRGGATLPDRFLNNAFDGWDGAAQIHWPERGVSAIITAPDHSVAMLYSPSAEAGFFCWEPMTHLPNGHRQPEFGGLRLLEPGEAMQSTMTIDFRRDDLG